MPNRQLTISYPEALLLGLKESPEEFQREAAFLLAAKLFEMRKISSGRGAAIAGMDRVSFLFSLHRYGIPVLDLTPEEFEQEVRDA